MKDSLSVLSIHAEVSRDGEATLSLSLDIHAVASLSNF